MSSLVISNVRLIDQPETPVDVHIVDGLIARITDPGLVGPAGGKIDGTGKFLSPGLVDIHLQGAGGADVLEGTSEALAQICQSISRFGTTAWLATTIYAKGADNHHLHRLAEAARQSLGGARILGIHLEGPFINPAKCGMIHPRFITPPDENVLDEILDLCGPALKMMTIAPELPGALKLIEKLVSRGVVASFGHSDATYDQAKAGISAGISHVTHLFNAMRPMLHRDPGPIPALLQDDRVTVQFISDGVHIESPMAWLISRTLKPERLCLITDGIELLGCPDGEFMLQHKTPIIVQNGIARSKDGTLAGSAVGFSECVSRFCRFTGWPIQDAVRSASLTPSSVLGLSCASGPMIRAGGAADLVLVGLQDEQFSVLATVVNGEIVYKACIR